jgi:hypothetical protein
VVDRHTAAELRAKKFLRPAEAAILVNRDKATINRWITKGLRAYTDEETGDRFVLLKDVRDWINNRGE